MENNPGKNMSGCSHTRSFAVLLRDILVSLGAQLRGAMTETLFFYKFWFTFLIMDSPDVMYILGDVAVGEMTVSEVLFLGGISSHSFGEFYLRIEENDVRRNDAACRSFTRILNWETVILTVE